MPSSELLRTHAPKTDELTRFIESIMTEHPPTSSKTSPTMDELVDLLYIQRVHATVLDRQPTWRVPERRTAKFVKRLQQTMGAGIKRNDATDTSSVTSRASSGRSLFSVGRRQSIGPGTVMKRNSTSSIGNRTVENVSSRTSRRDLVSSSSSSMVVPSSKSIKVDKSTSKVDIAKKSSESAAIEKTNTMINKSTNEIEQAASKTASPGPKSKKTSTIREEAQSIVQGVKDMEGDKTITQPTSEGELALAKEPALEGTEVGNALPTMTTTTTTTTTMVKPEDLVASLSSVIGRTVEFLADTPTKLFNFSKNVVDEQQHEEDTYVSESDATPVEGGDEEEEDKSAFSEEEQNGKVVPSTNKSMVALFQQPELYYKAVGMVTAATLVALSIGVTRSRMLR